jgi:titin
MIRKGLVRTSAPQRLFIHIFSSLVGILGFSGPFGPGDANASQLTLVWEDASNNELGFKIERRLGNTGIFVQIATVPANVTSYTDLNLLPSTAYYYRVRAFDGIWDSAYSNIAGDITSGGTGGGGAGGGGAGIFALAASTLDSRRLRLNWEDKSSGESGFRIERKRLGSNIFTHVATVGSNVSAYTDVGLDPKSTYIYRIRTIGGLAHSTYSKEASATTLSPVPSRPSSLSATTTGSGSVGLQWLDAADNETAYKIERRAAGSSIFTQIATVGPNVVTYADTGLKQSTTYVYRVRAAGSSGHSPYSNQAGTSTFPAAPSAPDNVSAAAIDSRSLRLNWMDTSPNETGFKIERKSGLLGNYVQIAVVSAGVTTYVNSGLSAGRPYFYRIRSFNSGGSSAYSKPVAAITVSGGGAGSGAGGTGGTSGGAGAGGAATGSGAASGSGADSDSESVSGSGAATGGAASGSGATGGAASGSGAAALVGGAVASVGVTVDTLRVAATAESSLALSVAEEPQPLSALLVDDRQVLLAWIDESESATGFVVERKTGESGTYEKVAEIDAGVVEYADIALTAETTYYYRIAMRLAEEVVYSNEVIITTGGSVAEEQTAIVSAADSEASGGQVTPAVPQDFSATVLEGQSVTLSWGLVSENTAGFVIERKTGENGEYDQIAEINADVTSFTDTDVALETTYFYRVAVLGAADYSKEAAVTTGPAAASSDHGEDGADPAAPSANPQDLTASISESQHVQLTWTASSNGAPDLVYLIERAIDQSEAYEEIAVVGPQITSYTDEDVFPGSTYSYRMRGRDARGDSEYSNVASVTLAEIDEMIDLEPIGNPPPSPEPLSASLVAPQEVALTWNGAAETSENLIFIIDRAIGSNAGYEEVAAVRGDVSSLIDSNLAPATTYFYRVRASNGFGDSEYSNEVSVTTGSGPDNPDPDTGSGAGSGSGSGSGVGTEPPLSDNNTGSGTTGGTGGGGGNDPGQAEPPQAPPPVETVPATPANVTATAVAGRRIVLSWTDVSNHETGFTIERGTGLGNYAPINVVGPDVTSYTDYGLLGGTTYFYRLRANGTAGQSEYSNESSATTDNGAAPVDPGSGAGSGAGGGSGVPNKPESFGAMLLSAWQVALVWTDVSNNEIGFTIERSTALSSYNQIAVVGANVCAFTDNGLMPGTTYFYRVRANGSAGNSEYSNETSATTGGTLPQNSGASGGGNSSTSAPAAPAVTLPANPQGLTATLSSASQAALAWTDASGTETGFTIERSIGDNGFAELAIVEANVSSYTDSALSPGTTYSYRVRANSAAGYSGYSNEASVTVDAPPPPPGPSGSATFITLDSSTRGSWDGLHGHEGYYLMTGPANLPSYAQMHVANASDLVWAASSHDPRALQQPGNSERLAASWSSPASFLMDLDLTDGATHRVAFYCVDWDGGGRVQTIEILDPATDAILQSQMLSTFTDGAYLVWDLQGQVRIRITRVAGENAVLSGIFFNSLQNPQVQEPSQPVAPTLNIGLVNGQSPSLTWTSTAGIDTGFTIERRATSSAQFEVVASLGSDVTSHIDPYVSSGTTYVYRILALHASGGSAYSNEASITTASSQITSGSGIVYPGQTSDLGAGSGANSGVQDEANTEPPTLTAQDFGSYALARVDGRPGQRFLVQVPDPAIAWKGLQIVTVTDIGYAFVVIDSHGPDSTFYRALPLD